MISFHFPQESNVQGNNKLRTFELVTEVDLIVFYASVRLGNRVIRIFYGDSVESDTFNGDFSANLIWRLFGVLLNSLPCYDCMGRAL